MPHQATVYLGLGSNLGNPEEQIQQAFEHIGALPQVTDLRLSPLYQSDPVGPPGQPDYINAVLELKTDYSPIELLHELQNIEQTQGRVRLEHWGPRTIDLDIVLFGNIQHQTEELQIPHAEMKNRHFVLFPLSDLAPLLVLPCGTPLAELVARTRPDGIRRLLTPSSSQSL